MPICPSFLLHAPATTAIYTLSLHDALPISPPMPRPAMPSKSFTPPTPPCASSSPVATPSARPRSEEHTSELQSHSDLVCRLLLEKNKIAKAWQPHADVRNGNQCAPFGAPAI